MIGNRWLYLLQRREYSVCLVLALIYLVMGFRRPDFFTPANFADILTGGAYLAIISCGMTAVILAGQIDLSVGSLLAVCSAVAGLTAKAGWPLTLVILTTLSTGTFLGFLNGFLVAFLQLPSLLVTLGAMTALRGLMIWATGGRWISDLPPHFLELGQGSGMGLPYPVWLAFLALLFFGFILTLTPTGRNIYAVGSNPQAARVAGISLRGVTLLVFLLSGLSVGIGTLAYAPRFSVIQTDAGQGLELQVITATVVGGTSIFGGSGTLWGTALAVLLLSTLRTAITFLHISAFWEPAVQGVLVLLAVLGDTLFASQKSKGIQRSR